VCLRLALGCSKEVCDPDIFSFLAIENSVPPVPSSEAEALATDDVGFLPVPFLSGPTISSFANVDSQGVISFENLSSVDVPDLRRGYAVNPRFDDRFDDRVEIKLTPPTDNVLSDVTFQLDFGSVIQFTSGLGGTRAITDVFSGGFVNMGTWSDGDVISYVSERVSCNEFREGFQRNGVPIEIPGAVFPAASRIVEGLAREITAATTADVIRDVGGPFFLVSARVQFQQTITMGVEWEAQRHTKTPVGPVVWNGDRGTISGLTPGFWYEFIVEGPPVSAAGVTDCIRIVNLELADSQDGLRFIFQAIGNSHEFRVLGMPGFDTSQLQLGQVNCIFDNSCENIGIWRLSGDSTVNEGDDATYTISLDGEINAGQVATIEINITDVDTTSADYQALSVAMNNAITAYTGPGTLAFSGSTLTFTSDGNAMDDLEITLTATDDTEDEQDEDYTISISNPDSTTGARISGTGSVTTTIIDNDEATGDGVEVTFQGVTTTVMLDDTGNGSAVAAITNLCGDQVTNVEIAIVDNQDGTYVFSLTADGDGPDAGNSYRVDPATSSPVNVFFSTPNAPGGILCFGQPYTITAV